MILLDSKSGENKTNLQLLKDQAHEEKIWRLLKACLRTFLISELNWNLRGID